MNDSRSFQISSDQVPDAPEPMPYNKSYKEGKVNPAYTLTSTNTIFLPTGTLHWRFLLGGGNGPPREKTKRYKSGKSTARATRLGGSVSRGKVYWAE
jgi:hypothetical protein